MKIHEYQAKEILRKYGVATPRGIPCFRVDEAVDAAAKLGGKVWVVKAQIHAGGRGKGGGVKVAKSAAEVKAYAGSILGMQLKTHQTGPEGQKVRRLLIEEGADIRKEYYLGVVLDRARRVPVLIDGDQALELSWSGGRWRTVHAGAKPLRGLAVSTRDEHQHYHGYHQPTARIDGDRARASLLSWLGVGTLAVQLAPLPRSAPGSLRLLYLDTRDPVFRPAAWREQGQHAVLWDLCVQEPASALAPEVEGPAP